MEKEEKKEDSDSCDCGFYAIETTQLLEGLQIHKYEKATEINKIINTITNNISILKSSCVVDLPKTEPLIRDLKNKGIEIFNASKRKHLAEKAWERKYRGSMTREVRELQARKEELEVEIKEKLKELIPLARNASITMREEFEECKIQMEEEEKRPKTKKEQIQKLKRLVDLGFEEIERIY